MLEAAKAAKSRLQELRKDSTFDELLTKVEDIKRWGLKPLQLPPARKPLARFDGLTEACKADAINTHYRIEYLKLIDVAIQQLDDRLLNCPGLIRYCELEAILLSGNINESVIPLYPELFAPTRGSFKSQVDMFLSLPEIAQIT